jgi:hypothetical protein
MLEPFLTCHSPPGFSAFGIKAPKSLTAQAAYLGITPDFRSLPSSVQSFLTIRCRIIVPGPLRLTRLAVPLTSWNHLHDAPKSFIRQS